MITGEMVKAKALLRAHVAEFPRDAQCLSLAMLILPGGASDSRAKRLAFLQQYAGAYGDDWWFLGTLGMAMEEDDRFTEARRLTERSLALYPRNGGAAHWLAHVYYETSDHSAGREFLDGWMGPYPSGAPHHCHFLWHLALFEITSGHYRRALDLFEHGISGAAGARSQLPDAASLLWRCRLYGYAPATLPWDVVQAITAQDAFNPSFALLAAHAALAYAGAGDLVALDALEQALRDLTARGNEVAGSVTASLAAGIGAFARGQYDDAVRLLTPIAGEIVRIGGSNAQREVFEETLLEAMLRSGRFDEAEALLRRRLGRRESGRDNFWLGRVYAGRGETALAAEQRRAGAQLWPTADADAPELAAGGNVTSVGRTA